MDWSGTRVAIVPCPALGDVTLYLHLAWIFHLAGAHVLFVSSTLYPAARYFGWLRVESSECVNLPLLSEKNDLVISYINWLTQDGDLQQQALQCSNIAFVSAKKLPLQLGIDGREVKVGARAFANASRALCLNSRAGMSMVQWVEEYAASIFGLVKLQSMPMLRLNFSPEIPKRVAIFPTTPHPKKNYTAIGFRWLARRLEAKGWCVEFVGMPHEYDVLNAAYKGFPLHAFNDVGGLMDYLATCSVVVSNDSGGGHLGSLMGLRTFTITRKKDCFVWRPGFNERNRVLAPLTSIKLFGRYIWKPFIPIWCIPNELGELR